MHEETVIDHLADFKVDKSRYPEGPWMNEPDRIEWRHRGYPCLIVRSDIAGSLCGYVGVFPQHPYYEKEYDAVNDNIAVHGSLNYSDSCAGPICHIPQEGEADTVWWLGFDCGHFRDFSPGVHQNWDYQAMGFSPDRADELKALDRNRTPPHPHLFEQVYRDISYVRAEVERLADQLAEINQR